MEWPGNTQKKTDRNTQTLFDAGVLYLSSGAFVSAYACFERIADKSFSLLFNKALCCFGVSWYEECYRLLCDAERLLPTGMDPHPTGLPEIFLRWECENAQPLSPILPDIPASILITPFLRLKAETAFKLHLYEEVKKISARLGGKYKPIGEPIKPVNDDNE